MANVVYEKGDNIYRIRGNQGLVSAPSPKAYLERRTNQTMDKNKGEWQGREVGMARVRGGGGGKGRKLYLNNNKIQKYLIKKRKRNQWGLFLCEMWIISQILEDP